MTSSLTSKPKSVEPEVLVRVNVYSIWLPLSYWPLIGDNWTSRPAISAFAGIAINTMKSDMTAPMR
ncbi:hypothetical protein, partial [Vibrio campbellii]|uniref:hypothetical protein n=1 Tax=Vibrio campbellii TaxID=680 RepID=UPI001E51892A